MQGVFRGVQGLSIRLLLQLVGEEKPKRRSIAVFFLTSSGSSLTTTFILFNTPTFLSDRMILGIVYATVDGEGLYSYAAKLYCLEEKPFSMMGRGPSWVHKEIAVLVENRDDLDKAAKLLGRSRAACQKQLERLGLSILRQKGKIFLVFPERQIDCRRAVVKQVMPRLKTLLEKIDKTEDLTPETISDLAKIVRAMATLFNALEKWQTGEEMLEIWKGEVKEARAQIRHPLLKNKQNPHKRTNLGTTQRAKHERLLMQT